MTNEANATNTNYFFSQRVDERLKQTVCRIQGKHTSFASDFLSLGAVNGPESIAERIEAWQTPDGFWQLKRLTRVPGQDLIKMETLAHQACFFDALHHCAQFQARYESLDGYIVTMPGELWEKATHFRAAAEAAGQAIDEDGELHPCAFGHVLTDGWFSNEVLQIAARTKDIPLGPRMPANSFIGASMDQLLDLKTDSELEKKAEKIVANTIEKRDLLRRFETVIKVGDNLIKQMDEYLEWEFKSDFEDNMKGTAITKAVLSGGVAALIGISRGDPHYNINRSFQVLKDKFETAARALPDDCEEKHLALQFAKAAAFTFWMERAKQVYKECMDGESKAEALTKKGFPHVEKAGQVLEYPAHDITHLQDEYLETGLKDNDFYETLKKQWIDRASRYDEQNISSLKFKLTSEIEGIQNNTSKFTNQSSQFPFSMKRVGVTKIG